MNYLKAFIAFLIEIYHSRRIILELTKQDFRARYLGSFLGIIWAFIQPTVTILVLWFVFQVGFKSSPVDDFPFILWLICGMVPWFFFSESLSGGTNSVIDNSYLVKKVVFRVSILPIIKILSALIVHGFFILFIIFMFLLYGYPPTIYVIQVLYYLFASIVLVLGLSWITSSVVVFLKDLGQVVNIILQFGFWLTPIFWSAQAMPLFYLRLIKLNPMYYIVDGYRNTFIYHKWFWESSTYLTYYFWGFTIFVFVLGAITFKRLRPHFADIL